MPPCESSKKDLSALQTSRSRGTTGKETLTIEDVKIKTRNKWALATGHGSRSVHWLQPLRILSVIGLVWADTHVDWWSFCNPITCFTTRTKINSLCHVIQVCYCYVGIIE